MPPPSERFKKCTNSVKKLWKFFDIIFQKVNIWWAQGYMNYYHVYVNLDYYLDLRSEKFSEKWHIPFSKNLLIFFLKKKKKLAVDTIKEPIQTNFSIRKTFQKEST